MEEGVARTIARLKNWTELASFEKNAREKHRLTDEIATALAARSAELGHAYIALKTGIELANLSPAEEKVVRAAAEYVGILRRQGKNAERTLLQLRNRGLRGAVENSVVRAEPTMGYTTLVEADQQDLSYEKIVVDHAEEFSARALWYSRRTLGLPNESETAPVDEDGDTQNRTEIVLVWLREIAAANDGLLDFSNADVAAQLGFEPPQKFGRVHGNIQSRIDFACFLCNLPPLGLAADAPFEKAWGNEKRQWQFPVAAMQIASQARTWEPDDFEQVLRKTRELSGLSGVLWRDALAADEGRLKAWAFGFLSPGDGGIAVSSKQERNPRWTRDELILALDLYLRTRASPPSKGSPEIVGLSELLNNMARALGLVERQTFRNENGVYMKLMNFRRLDPSYTSEGKVGLSRGNKDEEVVWREFVNRPQELSLVVAAIRAAMTSNENTHELDGIDEPGMHEAPEGRVLTRVHRYRERNRKLVEARKTQALAIHGRLFCEACGFEFVSVYGADAARIIDCHHTRPLHTLGDGTLTRLEDLALLCANCHRVVHSRKIWLTVEQLRELIDETRQVRM